MLILHASSLGYGVLVWGEARRERAANDVDGGPAGKPLPYVRGVTARELASTLRSIVPGSRFLKRHWDAGYAWFPSVGGVPLPSSPAIADLPAGGGCGAESKAFRVEGLLLGVGVVAELASLARERRSPVAGVAFGPSFAWLGRVFGLSSGFVEAEAFIPGVVRELGAWISRWKPAPSDALFVEICRLAQEMPAAFRCMAATPKEVPAVAPRLVLQEVLGRILDHQVRGRLSACSSLVRFPSPSSLHEAWLSSLSSQNPCIAWPNPDDVEQFSKELGQWQRPIDLVSRSPFTFCFRICEPTGAPAAPWRVEYLIQAKEDPSLKVPVADVWTQFGPGIGRLRQHGGGIPEFVLMALSQASGVCPGVARSLADKQPGGFDTDVDGAFRFLSVEGAVLRAAGFTVIMPSWWTGKTKALGMRAKVRSPEMTSEAGLGLDRVIEFDFEAAMGGEALDASELEALARARSSLIQLRGTWMEVDPRQIAKAVKFLKGRGKGRMSASDLVRIALGADGDVSGIPIQGVDADGWLRELIDRLVGREEFEMQPQPAGLKGNLRPYQLRGMSWMRFLSRWGLGACLADDMGLGKTIQTLALLQGVRERGDRRPVLLLCPTSVLNNWRKESAKFTPDITTLIHHGTGRHKPGVFAEAAAGAGLVVSSYGLLVRDLETLSQVDWAGVVLDEAQNIKNPATKQSQSARSLKAGFRVALTGTPVENHVGDLWALMDFLNPGWLGTQASFKRVFHTPIQKFQDGAAADRLRRITGPFVMRRLKTDKTIIDDLPEKLESKDYCPLTKEQAALYQSVVDAAEDEIAVSGGMKRRGLVLALLARLKQVCNHPAHFLGDNSRIGGRSGKLERLEEIVDEVRERGERLLVFTQFTEMGEMLQRHLRETRCEEVLFLHGALARPARDAMIERFQNDPDGPGIFILSLKAGGTGLTLTRANHVVHFDRWWNPAVEDQATDRAFRIGQRNQVQVHKFIVAGTLEERIDDMIERKKKVTSKVVGTGEAWLSELSNEELRDLINLGRDAVAD